VKPPATKMVELARQTYPPHAADRHWAGGPTVLVVESGALTVAHAPISTEAATVIPASTERRSLPPGGVATLAAGDALFVGSGVFETRNLGATPAVVLTLWSGSPTFPRGDLPGPPVPGSTYEALAGGHPAPLPEDRATVAIGRIALAPGAAVDRHRVANVEFVVVESGRLALSVEDGKSWVGAGSTEATPVGTNAPLADGAGVAFDAGTTVAFGPAGNEPLVVLVIAIGPAIDGVAAAF
jgi:quercetin dioxygenase-like cupin family protein